MSSYHHAFVLGFNWWIVIGILAIASMVYLGIRRFDLNNRNLKIVRHYSSRVFMVVAAIEASIFTVMVFIESLDGVIQFFDNCLTAIDSPVWSLVFAPVSIVIAGVLFFSFLLIVASISNDARMGALCEERKKILREQRRAYGYGA